MNARVIFVAMTMILVIYLVSDRFVWQQDTKQLNQVRARVDNYLQYDACVREGPFPFSTIDGKKNRYGELVHYCQKCDLLTQAGLLTKEVIKYDVPPSMERQRGETIYEVVYDLTDLGRSLYVEGTTDDKYDPKSHRFCLGKARIKKFTRIIGPRRLGTTTYATFKYIAVLDNPHPYLNDPRAKLLGIELPSGNPPVYKESHTTAVLDSNGEIESFDGYIEFLN